MGFYQILMTSTYLSSISCIFSPIYRGMVRFFRSPKFPKTMMACFAIIVPWLRKAFNEKSMQYVYVEDFYHFNFFKTIPA